MRLTEIERDRERQRQRLWALQSVGKCKKTLCECSMKFKVVCVRSVSAC